MLSSPDVVPCWSAPPGVGIPVSPAVLDAVAASWPAVAAASGDATGPAQFASAAPSSSAIPSVAAQEFFVHSFAVKIAT